MEKHTPGPWEIEPDPDNPGHNFVRPAVAVAVHDCDAKLIAAAPELLEAAKVAARALDRYVSTLKEQGNFLASQKTAEKLDYILEIIAKAGDMALLHDLWVEKPSEEV